MAVPTEIPLPVKKVIVRDYLSGMSIAGIKEKYRSIPKHRLRALLHEAEVVRRRDVRRSDDPTLEEIETERDRFKNSWSEQETVGRWVGRQQSVVALERCRALSKVIPN